MSTPTASEQVKKSDDPEPSKVVAVPPPSLGATSKSARHRFFDKTYMATLEPGESGLVAPVQVRRGTRWLDDNDRDDNYFTVIRYTHQMSDDFGFCKSAFRKEGEPECSAGAECAWRHHPLTEGEINQMTGRWNSLQNLKYKPQKVMVTRWDAET